MLNPTDLAIELWPPEIPGGMRVGVPKGVKVLHKPTGCWEVCVSERSQHRNRELAIAALERRVAAKLEPPSNA